MGRPSLTAPRRGRGGTKVDDSDSASTPTYRRRFPRIGGAFQLKKPPAVGDSLSSRPEPLLYSKDIPYRTMKELTQPDNSLTACSESSLETSSELNNDRVAGYESTVRTQRGGLLLHSCNAKDAEDISYCLPLVSTAEATDESQRSDTFWSELLHWQERSTTARKSKSRWKRKNPDPPEPPRPTKRTYKATENDESILAYKQLRHNGNSEQLRLGLVIESTGGCARSARRAANKERTETWQEEYFESTPVVFGDFRDSKRSTGPGAIEAPKREELWNAVLASAQAIERDIASSKPVMLAEILTILDHASKLGRPEDAFSGMEDRSVLGEVRRVMRYLLDLSQAARRHHAKLVDLWSEDGVDADALKKLLDSASKETSVVVDDTIEMRRELSVVTEWQKRLDVAWTNCVDEDHDDLSSFEALISEAKTHGFRCKSLLLLEARVEKAKQIRDRIDAWKGSCLEGTRETIKFTGAIVRDIGRLKFFFPEAREMIAFQRNAECWVDRANIAIRSRISLAEVQTLITRGKGIALDLSEYLDKLETRKNAATEWLNQFKARVPFAATLSLDTNKLEWMRRIRRELDDGAQGELQEFASDGSRIPVELECVKLLQIEIDARNWAAKARKWLPTGDGDTDPGKKKGKLEDLQEHLVKAAAIRDRLELPSEEKGSWVLEGEIELRDVVRKAEHWCSKHETLIEWDTRRSQKRPRLSVCELRSIVDECNSIHCNLGSASSKLTRIQAQAEAWHSKCSVLIQRCKCQGGSGEFVELAELTAAIEAASADVLVELDEAKELESLAGRIQTWFDEAAQATGGKRRRSKKSAVNLSRLGQLIEEASLLPVDTSQETARLRTCVEAIEQWQAGATKAMENIRTAFLQLREVVNETFGDPSAFVHRTGEDDGNEADPHRQIHDAELDSEHRSTDETTAEAAPGLDDHSSLPQPRYGGENVHMLIENFVKEAQASSVDVPECDDAAELLSVSKWLMRSMKYLESQRDVFDKRFFGAFDRFVKQGRDLVLKPKEGDGVQKSEATSARLQAAWESVLQDQLKRLECILSKRERYVAWCRRAERLLADDKKVPREKLRDIADKSFDFPGSCELSKKIRSLDNRATGWIESTREALLQTDKMTLQKAKAVLDAGEKLGIMSDELKTLRNGLRVAKGWAARVKRCKVDQGATHVSDVKTLLQEHSGLIVALPEEVEALEQATKNYCICRRPYEGFMIGCDSCDDWFHGPCIGVSESRAGRFDKYVCPRCSVARVYKASALAIAGVVKKWLCGKDRRKARQVEGQKHQRKVRKETKDIETLDSERQSVRDQLSNLSQDNSAGVSLQGIPDKEVMLGTPETQNVANGQTDEKPPSPREALERRLADIENALANCHSRRHALDQAAIARRNEQEVEDANSSALRSWCLRVRSEVLVPETTSDAQRSCPNSRDGSISDTMLQLVDEAGTSGLDRFQDVQDVVNAFKCLAWSIRASAILATRPYLSEVESLVKKAATMKLPDEKAFRMLKSLLQRANSWGNKVSKALAPSPGQAKPFDLSTLRDLVTIAEDIPLHMPLEQRLLTVIEDNGGRHCLCGGPSDGRFMLSCDQCERWYHGQCVNVTKEMISQLKEWRCPGCSGATVSTSSLDLANFHKNVAEYIPAVRPESCCGSPKVEDMWPPYGLQGSATALEALGKECCEAGNIPPPVPPPVQQVNPRLAQPGSHALVPPPRPAISGSLHSHSNMPPPSLNSASMTTILASRVMPNFHLPLYPSSASSVQLGLVGTGISGAKDLTVKADTSS